MIYQRLAYSLLPLGEAMCWQVAQGEARKRIALDEEEQAAVDAYIAERIKKRPRPHRADFTLIVLPEAC